MSKNHFQTDVIRKRMDVTSQKEHSSPLYLTSSFMFDTAEEGGQLFSGEKAGNLYSRFSNPSVDEFISRIALLEGYEAGVATASGMAAIYSSFIPFLKQGDHILASKELFGNTLHILTEILPQMGVDYTLVEVDKNDHWESAVRENTRIIFVESPSNPTLKIADLEFLGRLCQSKGILYLVDNCFATPIIQRPIIYDADLVIHSATKYLDGQGRVLGGAIVGKPEPVKKIYDFIRRTGASLSPFNAWVLSKSLEILSLRMERHCSNAQSLAQYLESCPYVEEVLYPHLKSFPQHDLAKKQMSMGGGLVGCRIKGSQKETMRFINSLKNHSLTANLGDAKSIVTHPTSTTHSKLSDDQRKEVGITDNYVRFSVGLEHIDDLIEDVDNALKEVR